MGSLKLLVLAVAAAASSVAVAQSAAPYPAAATATVIAVPTLATPKDEPTEAGSTWALANQMADVITSDLKSTNAFIIADVKSVRIPSYPEVTAPSYALWRGVGAKALLSGFIQKRSDGRLMIGCYVYDVQKERELTRTGFLVVPADWRRAAHRCADAAYSELTGNGPLFDSRVAFVAQSGDPSALTKRIAVMDLDGTNFTYLTTGGSTALTPRWSPNGKVLAYALLGDGPTHVELYDLATKKAHSLLPGGTSFAPAFSPDGDRIALTIPSDGNSDIYTARVDGTGLRRLTTSPAIDTGASFSPDGKQIVFSSDRSGLQQLYVMNADGTGQRRISFGAGEFGAPDWSPDGKHIAFTQIINGGTRIGVMDADGTHVRFLTGGPYDSQASWGPSAEHVMFERFEPATRRTALYTVSIDRPDPRRVSTPQAASDPSWVTRQ